MATSALLVSLTLAQSMRRRSIVDLEVGVGVDLEVAAREAHLRVTRLCGLHANESTVAIARAPTIATIAQTLSVRRPSTALNHAIMSSSKEVHRPCILFPLSLHRQRSQYYGGSG